MFRPAISALDGRYERVAGSVLDLLGYGPGLVGTHFRDITHPDDIDLTESHQRPMVAGTLDAAILHKRYVMKGGGILRVRSRVVLRRDRNGQPTHAELHIEPVTNAAAWPSLAVCVDCVRAPECRVACGRPVPPHLSKPA